MGCGAAVMKRAGLARCLDCRSRPGDVRIPTCSQIVPGGNGRRIYSCLARFTSGLPVLMGPMDNGCSSIPVPCPDLQRLAAPA